MNKDWVLNENKILEGFQPRPWDGTSRPQHYRIDIIEKGLMHDCLDFVDIPRNGDGMLASLYISRSCFMFFVWNGSNTIS